MANGRRHRGIQADPKRMHFDDVRYRAVGQSFRLHVIAATNTTEDRALGDARGFQPALQSRHGAFDLASDNRNDSAARFLVRFAATDGYA